MSQADDQEPFLPAEAETELLARLRAAFRPGELDSEVNERLLAVALEDPFAPPTEAELIESQRLREALDDGTAHPDADVLRALGAPFAALDDAALERALAAAERAPGPAEPPRRNVVYVVFGAGSAALAAAAAIALLFAAPRGPSRRRRARLSFRPSSSKLAAPPSSSTSASKRAEPPREWIASPAPGAATYATTATQLGG